MKKIYSMTLTFFVFLVIPFAAKCALDNAHAAGKPEKLVYGAIMDLTGPYAPIVGASYPAFMDAAEYVNDTGGIRGVPLEVLVRDCGGKDDVTINMYMQMREMKPRPSVIYVAVSSHAKALKDRFAEDKIIGFCVPEKDAIYPTGFSFGAFTSYADSCGLFMDWLAGSWKEKRAPRLAFLTWDSAYGKAVIYDEVYNYAKSKGIEVVGTEYFGIRDLHVTNQLMRIRAKKADWVFGNILGNGPVVMAKSAKDMGYKVGIAAGLGLDDSSLFINREVLEGAVAVHPFANWSETDNNGIQIMNKYFIKNKRRPTHRTIMYPLGWTGVLVFREAVERIVDKYGWEKVNGDGIKKEMERLDGFSPIGLTTFSYTPDRYSPNVAKVFQCKGGKWRPLTGLSKCPDLRPADYRK